MEPDFKDLAEFRIVGLAGQFSPGTTAGIPRLWEQFMTIWSGAANACPAVCYGVCFGGPDPSAPFTYLAAFPEEGLPEPPAGLEIRTIPANRYAVFTHRGPVMQIGATYEAAFANWFPTSGYRRADGPDFELYDERFDPESMGGEVDIYIPVTRD